MYKLIISIPIWCDYPDQVYLGKAYIFFPVADVIIYYPLLTTIKLCLETLCRDNSNMVRLNGYSGDVCWYGVVAGFYPNPQYAYISMIYIDVIFLVHRFVQKE